MDPRNNSCSNGDHLFGRYANYFKVGFNAFELVFHFGQSYAEGKEAQPCTRIVTSPVYAKIFLIILKESIEQYEAKYGIIPDQ